MQNASSAHPENRPGFFSDWSTVLENARLTGTVRVTFRSVIVAYLRRCKQDRVLASIMHAKRYIAEAEAQGATEVRRALRWFFVSARSAEKLVLAQGVRQHQL